LMSFKPRFALCLIPPMGDVPLQKKRDPFIAIPPVLAPKSETGQKTASGRNYNFR